ncbi:phosphate acyltransferase PlsX [Gallibacterium trehalosifermentans]|uniref:Phosphate acyltransferase n=1 Tax=Gallibacterium trehalosifermentans TaxID=516935 RepID=A0ABV6GZP8_9PAST
MSLTIALDMMGGDFGPRITVPAAIQVLENYPTLRFLFFGDHAEIQHYLPTSHRALSERITIHHCSRQIYSDTPIAQALRYSKGTSLRLSIEAVQKNYADACVSAGNTGALMGLSKILLQAIPGIQRPALTSLIPTMNGQHTVMLDLGANTEVSTDMLCQFAKMGSIFAENMLDLVYPRVALLNIGIEAIKGLPHIREAAAKLEQAIDLNYVGFIEGDQLLNHIADVIVADGFNGNIALKTLEGTAKNIIHLLKDNERSQPKWCAVWLQQLLRHFLKDKYQQLQSFNPDKHSGASLLGLQSVIVKSHGSSNSLAFAHAIEHAILQVKLNIPEKILTNLS